MAYWATAADVLNMTGKTVTEAQVSQAEAVIIIQVNRTPSASAAFSPRDLYWLKSAVCFQAAWMPDQPGYLQRQAADSVSQDGVTVVQTKEWQITLSPVAARAIKNLSWKGARTVRMKRPSGMDGRDGRFLNEQDDQYESWEPFSIGSDGSTLAEPNYATNAPVEF